MLRRLGAFFLYIYKRTFHIDPCDSGHVRGSFHIFYRREDFQKSFFCQSHGCRAVGGDPMGFLIPEDRL